MWLYQYVSIGFATAAITCNALSIDNKPNSSRHTTLSSRRRWIAKGLISSTASITLLLADEPSSAIAKDVDSLPNELKQYTALAPLGTPTSTGDKTTRLSLSDLAARLSLDLVDGSNGNGGYFISGDISTDIFRDDCKFIDPTNSVSSLSRYQNALKILFDPQQSYVELLEPLAIDESNKTINARIRSGGILQLPWHPCISPYESTITYSVDTDGLIASQTQQWSISASQALKETFTPFSVPYSSINKPQDEPVEVTQLFTLVNGKRPNGYTQSERNQIASLIDTIVAARYKWHREDLPGKWSLSYLQPGTSGEGIDRRIPFPDLPFNNNYQFFTSDTVTNIGEILGPILEVRVGGSLVEDDTSSLSTPKRFQANIEKGGLCLGGGSQEDSSCVPLPIKGEGIFDGVYLGKRLRIGQNINGGGARVVQVKIS